MCLSVHKLEKSMWTIHYIWHKSKNKNISCILCYSAKMIDGSHVDCNYNINQEYTVYRLTDRSYNKSLINDTVPIPKPNSNHRRLPQTSASPPSQPWLCQHPFAGRRHDPSCPKWHWCWLTCAIYFLSINYEMGFGIWERLCTLETAIEPLQQVKWRIAKRVFL